MKNNKGFTLIELIVVIAVIAMLSITISVSTKKLTENTKNSSYKNTFEDIFKAARTYSNLYVVPSGCVKCDGVNNCQITIKCLITKGLLDEDIIKTSNPMKKDGSNFSEGDIVEVSLNTDTNKNKKTIVSYNCNGNIITSENIYTKKFDDWGKC